MDQGHQALGSSTGHSKKHHKIGDFRRPSLFRPKKFFVDACCVGLLCFSCSNPFVTYLPPPSAIVAAFPWRSAHFCCPLQIRPQRYCCRRFRSVHQIGLSKARDHSNTILIFGAIKKATKKNKAEMVRLLNRHESPVRAHS